MTSFSQNGRMQHPRVPETWSTHPAVISGAFGGHKNNSDSSIVWLCGASTNAAEGRTERRSKNKVLTVRWVYDVSEWFVLNGVILLQPCFGVCSPTALFSQVYSVISTYRVSVLRADVSSAFNGASLGSRRRSRCHFSSTCGKLHCKCLHRAWASACGQSWEAAFSHQLQRLVPQDPGTLFVVFWPGAKSSAALQWTLLQPVFRTQIKTWAVALFVFLLLMTLIPLISDFHTVCFCTHISF